MGAISPGHIVLHPGVQGLGRNISCKNIADRAGHGHLIDSAAIHRIA